MTRDNHKADLEHELLATGGSLCWGSVALAGNRRRLRSAQLDWLGPVPHRLRGAMELLMLGLELEFISSVEKYPPFKALLKNARRGRKKKSRKIRGIEKDARRRARDFRKNFTTMFVNNPLLASLN